jgi:glutamine amidotransferase
MSSPRIAVLDYDAGNIRSAEKALVRAGADAFVTADAAQAETADALVVPGVGHFGQCVRQFTAAGLEPLVRRWVDEDRPLLGVCVGMQILYKDSEEDPDATGLGVLPGQVRRLPHRVSGRAAGQEYLAVPHMGWNTVTAVRDDPILEGVAAEQVYFVHSFYAEPSDNAHVIATCDYGLAFPCVVRVGNVIGTQFHPEKSAFVGGRLLANWVAEVRACR